MLRIGTLITIILHFTIAFDHKHEVNGKCTFLFSNEILLFMFTFLQIWEHYISLQICFNGLVGDPGENGCLTAIFVVSFSMRFLETKGNKGLLSRSIRPLLGSKGGGSKNINALLYIFILINLPLPPGFYGIKGNFTKFSIFKAFFALSYCSMTSVALTRGYFSYY